MILYIKQFSDFIDDNSDIVIKNELKKRYKLDTRRQDKFIHLAIYGAQLLKDKIDIDCYDELYVTSGVGDVDIVEKTNTCIYEDHEPLRIFDFINLLGNTTSYYVAKSLNIKGKNIFQISDNFTYINTLISAYSSLKNSKKDAIICSVDLVSNNEETIKRVLDVDLKDNIISAVNYQKVSLNIDNAIGQIEFDTNIYDKRYINEMIKNSKEKIVYSNRCKSFKSEKDKFIFETIASYEVNSCIKKQQDIVYIDCYKDKYKILKIKSFK